MSDERGEEKIPDVVINGKTYEALADGVYDCVIMGTGLKECMLSGLLSVAGMKILHVDRNNYYGGESASLNLENLFKHFRGEVPDEKTLSKFGKNRDYNVDLIPKFIMACGVLVKILIHTKISFYLDFKSIAGSFVWKGSKKEVFKVPATSMEATKTGLMGIFQKKNFLQFLHGVKDINTGLHDANPESFKCPELDKITVQALFDKYGLDENSQDFVGHAMCLRTSDDYKTEAATKSIRALHLYVYSLNQYGVSPYLYPKWGLGGLPESFSRLCAVHGGTFMLEKNIDEVLLNEEGVAVGVRAGGQAASAKFVIGDASYFPKEKTKVIGSNVRSILILNHPLAGTLNAESAQIIIPAGQVGIAGYPARKHDIYVMAVSSENLVCSKGQYIAIVSTEVETKDPLKELQCGLDLVGAYVERFDYISDYKVPVHDGTKDKQFISESYDATSHFETTTADVLKMFERITGKPLDLSIDTSELTEK